MDIVFLNDILLWSNNNYCLSREVISLIKQINLQFYLFVFSFFVLKVHYNNDFCMLRKFFANLLDMRVCTVRILLVTCMKR